MLNPTLLFALLGCASALSITRRQLLGPNPYPTKPRITFAQDGTFKLTVFSDLHFGENEEGPWGPVQDSSSIRVMKRVLKDEVPNYACVATKFSPFAPG